METMNTKSKKLPALTLCRQFGNNTDPGPRSERPAYNFPYTAVIDRLPLGELEDCAMDKDLP